MPPRILVLALLNSHLAPTLLPLTLRNPFAYRTEIARISTRDDPVPQHDLVARPCRRLIVCRCEIQKELFGVVRVEQLCEVGPHVESQGRELFVLGAVPS